MKTRSPMDAPRGAAPQASRLTVTAILFSRNDEDVIEQVLTDLIAQGISVYLLERASTDRTVEIARSFLGRGVVEIERLEDAPGPMDEEAARQRLLVRTQTL